MTPENPLMTERTMRTSRLPLLIVSLALAASPGLANDKYAVKAGKVLTMAGDPIENGSHWRVFAQIKTEGEDKQEKSERVCYAVTINEPMSVVRSDFLN